MIINKCSVIETNVCFLSDSFSRFIYPSFVTIAVSSVLFPGGVGKYMAGHVSVLCGIDFYNIDIINKNREIISIKNVDIHVSLSELCACETVYQLNRGILIA